MGRFVVSRDSFKLSVLLQQSERDDVEQRCSQYSYRYSYVCTIHGALFEYSLTLSGSGLGLTVAYQASIDKQNLPPNDITAKLLTAIIPAAAARREKPVSWCV